MVRAVALARYSLFRGEPPPTIICALWHGGFSARQNPFALCYHAERLGVDGELARQACEYLRQFGRTREEQARAYYLWAQAVPLPFWRFFSHLPLGAFSEIVADMVPPYAVAQLLVRLDLYRHFRGAAVLDLFAGACGWLMALYFYPSHYWPRRWIAVDVDARRLQVCRLAGREMGVDVVTVRRDLSRPYAPPWPVDVVVGSPPCHEFAASTVSRRRRVGEGLALVRSYLDTVDAVGPRLAVMEEATSTAEAPALVGALVARRGFRYALFDLRRYGAIQFRRRRLVAWRAA